MRLFLIFHLFHLLLYESDSIICADDDDDDDGMEDEQKINSSFSKLLHFSRRRK